MKKFFAPFRDLPKGIFRLNIVCSIFIPFIIGMIMQLNSRYYPNGELFLAGLIIGFIMYWILARIGLWVYAGFIDDQSKVGKGE